MRKILFSGLAVTTCLALSNVEALANTTQGSTKYVVPNNLSEQQKNVNSKYIPTNESTDSSTQDSTKYVVPNNLSEQQKNVNSKYIPTNESTSQIEFLPDTGEKDNIFFFGFLIMILGIILIKPTKRGISK